MSNTFHFRDAVVRWPDKPALVGVDGNLLFTYAELDREANRAARAYGALGAQPEDCVALCLPNAPTLVAAILGAQRTGLYYTLVPAKAGEGDIDYIVADSGSKLLVIDETSPGLRELSMRRERYRIVRSCCSSPGAVGEWEALLCAQPDILPADPRQGMEMIYSSGTTGRPKGVRRPFAVTTWGEPDPRNVESARATNMNHTSTYLSTSPLYHTAPHRYLCAALGVGSTVVLMEKFDARTALACLDRLACTHSLWVPTMFHRLLKLDDDVRRAYTGRTHRVAVHGAAPCPAHVKRAMIEWWGPILLEYYSGTEGIGMTMISSAEWLAHPGSVGRPRGCAVHILDEHAEHELPDGQAGRVYFESAVAFDYWGDADKTRAATSPQGWRTFGDLGYVDADGYLYLTGRSGFTVISGGVNIYPQEVEDLLTVHPDVLDAAVFGVPDDDLGEKLVAIVRLADGIGATAAKAAELQEHCRRSAGSVKTPKAIEFCADDFPRLESGKVQKAGLRDAFLAARATPAPGAA